MANSITQGKVYIPMLDEAYKYASLTSVLDSDPSLIRIAENGKDFLVGKISLQGLGTTSRGGNYVGGDVTFAWETITPSYDRNRMFTVDAMDNIETAGLAFGQVAGEFIRTKVAPELDAFRISAYASTSSIGGATATLSAGADVLTALGVALTSLDENEVPLNGRYLFITPTLHYLVKNLATTASRELLEGFAGIIDIPQTRFYKGITLADGSTSGQEDGGYTKTTTTGADINFMIIQKDAVVQAIKHLAPKIVSPEANQTGDNWKFGYRIYGIAEVYDNKVKGVYCHQKAAG
jgi:hypothetical protein